MDKKAVSSHLEMIIAFTLFILFVFFMFVYIKPYQKTTVASSIVNGVQDSFENRVYTNMTKIFLKAQSPGCFSVDFTGIEKEGNSIVKTVSGSTVNSALSGNILSINSNAGFFNVYISKEFPNSVLSCHPLSVYTVGSIETKTLVSYSKLDSLKTAYQDSYDSLKQIFNVPLTAEFAIVSADGDYELERNIPANIQVMAISKDYDILYTDGTIENKNFIFKVW